MTKNTKTILFVLGVGVMLAIIGLLHPEINFWVLTTPYFIGWFASVLYDKIHRNEWTDIKKEFKDELDEKEIYYWEQHDEVFKHLEENYTITKK